MLFLAFSSIKGLSEKGLRSHVAINNYLITRDDNTTGIERFAEINPNRLLIFAMNNIGELTVHMVRKAKNDSALCVQGVAA